MPTAPDKCNIFFVSSLFLLCFPCFQLSFLHFFSQDTFNRMLSTTASIQRFLESLQYCTCIVRLQCTTCFGGSPSSNANKMYFNAFQCTVVVNCTMLRQGESICLLADLKFSSREYGLNTMWRDLCHVARKIWNPWLYFYALRSFHWINVSRGIIAQLSNDKHISALWV